MELRQIGSVDVDAGMIMIGDPCYVLPKDASRRSLVEDWSRFCAAVGTARVAEPAGAGAGLVVCPSEGDGEYPVWAEVTRSGRLRRVIIDLLPESDDWFD